MIWIKGDTDEQLVNLEGAREVSIVEFDDDDLGFYGYSAVVIEYADGAKKTVMTSKYRHSCEDRVRKIRLLLEDKGVFEGF